MSGVAAEEEDDITMADIAELADALGHLYEQSVEDIHVDPESTILDGWMKAGINPFEKSLDPFEVLAARISNREVSLTGLGAGVAEDINITDLLNEFK
jgi:hypothetical protein